MVRNAIRSTAAVLAVAVLLGGCGIRRKKYTNPITKDTQQPDKVLFDKAINDIEHSRFEIARLLLQNLINTYDTSEYLAKAKLAIADAWFREGGSHGLAQAEAEYKDFILFYPAMEEAAEAQEKVCDIHYKQMEKADRDPMHALRAEDECRQLLVQFPRLRQPLPGIGRPVPTLQPGRRIAVAACRFLPAYGRPLREPAGWRSHPHRQGLSAERARRCRPRQAEANEPARAGSRSGGLRAHEVRAGEPHQAGPDGPLLWGLPHQPYYEHGGQVGKPADDRSAAHHPGQRSPRGRRHPGRQLRSLGLHGGRQFRH